MTKSKDQIQKEIEALQAELNRPDISEQETRDDFIPKEPVKREPSLDLNSVSNEASGNKQVEKSSENEISPDGTTSREVMFLKYFLIFIAAATVLVLIAFFGNKIAKGFGGDSQQLKVAVVDLDGATQDAVVLASKGYNPAQSAKIVLASIINKASELQSEGYLILDKKAVFAGTKELVIIDWKSVYAEAQANGVDLLSTMNKLSDSTESAPLIRLEEIEGFDKKPRTQQPDLSGNPLGSLFAEGQ